jgi:hypothetical protein
MRPRHAWIGSNAGAIVFNAGLQSCPAKLDAKFCCLALGVADDIVNRFLENQ